MFPSYDETKDKCEWLAHGLREFVTHYNLVQGTTYELDKCLDVQVVAGRQKQPEPEVLVTGKRGEKPMVIEKKNIAVRDFILHSVNEDQFYTALVRQVGKVFNDDAYELVVSYVSLSKHKTKELIAAASDIAETLAKHALPFRPVRSQNPFPWLFRKRQDPDDERPGISLHIEDSPIWGLGTYFRERDTLQREFRTELEKQLGNATSKFAKYSDATKVVLLKFFSPDLDEEDARKVIASATIPATIDEVWMMKRNFISEDEYEITYERTFASVA